MIDFVSKYGHNVHSQNNEDGIIAECVKRLGLEKGHCVEVGGNNGIWMSNTAALLERGWSGAFVEADFGLWQQCRDRWTQRPDVKCICSRADERNINAFVDDLCDLLSVDTDGSDYEIFYGLKAKPKIVIVEIDSSIPPDSRECNADGAVGYLPMVELARRKGYFLLAHTGNLVLVDDQYWASHFPEITAHPLLDPQLYFNRSWLKAA